MWAFKTLWDKGLIYEGFKVLAYCWRCETPLSNTETRMDDVYRDRQDPALTVQFQLDSGERVLAWTTTPWTLPSNLALAVGPDIDYAVMEEDGVRYILAESRLGAYERELAERDAGRHHQGQRPRRPPLHAAVPVLRRHCQRVPGTRRRLRLHRGRHGHRAHGPRLRRGRPDRSQRGRHPDGVPDGRARSLHRRRRAVGGHACLRRQRRDRQGAEGSRRRRAPRQLQPLVPALLAMRPNRWCTGRSAVGSCRCPSFRDRMGELNQQIRWVPGARQGRQLRQVAGQRTRLEHQPQPLLGFADPGVAQRRSRTTRASMSTDRSPTSSATSASRSTTSTAPWSTTSCGRIPTTRPAGR